MKLIALMKKEFARFFGDYKLLITMILPGLLIYIIYSVMGSVMFGGEEEAYRLRVYVEGESAIVSTVESAASANGWETEMLSWSEAGIDEETARGGHVFHEDAVVEPARFGNVDDADRLAHADVGRAAGDLGQHVLAHRGV